MARMLPSEYKRSSKVNNRKLRDKGNVLLCVVLVGSRIRTIKVWIPGVDEPKVSVMCHERGGSDIFHSSDIIWTMFDLVILGCFRTADFH